MKLLCALALLAAASGSPSQEPLRVGGDVKAPVVIHRVDPVYPEQARKARISGIVILEAIIDETGRVTKATVLKPLPFGLDQAALDAVKQWEFRPGTLNGTAVPVIFNMTVNFKLEAPPAELTARDLEVIGAALDAAIPARDTILVLRETSAAQAAMSGADPDAARDFDLRNGARRTIRSLDIPRQVQLIDTFRLPPRPEERVVSVALPGYSADGTTALEEVSEQQWDDGRLHLRHQWLLLQKTNGHWAATRRSSDEKP